MAKAKSKQENLPVATEVLRLTKSSIKRMYAILWFTIILCVASLIDSIIQRCRIINILDDIETITTDEYIEMETDTGSNNYVGGDNYGDIENN